MRYITIGSGTAIPQSDRSAPCHLIHVGDQTIVVDLGPGAIWGLVRCGRVRLQDVGLLLFTHLHMDHCADLAPLLFALRSRQLERTEPLHILGPPGLREHHRGLQTIWEHRVDPDGFDLTVDEWAGRGFSWRGCSINAAPTAHSIPNLAWRIDAEDSRDSGIIITGDGQSTDRLIDLAGSADHILVAECGASPGEFVEGHMNPGQAGELALKCGSKKLVLNHINPDAEVSAILKEAMSRYDGKVIVAEDGMEIVID